MGGGLGVARIRVAQGQAQFANVEPVTFHPGFLEMIEGDPAHPPAVAIGITACADDKVFGHVILLSIQLPDLFYLVATPPKKG